MDDLFGLERLTDCFGILQLYRGVVAIVGPPFGGFIAEVSGNFNVSFLIAGILMIISGIFQWVTFLVASQEGAERARKREVAGSNTAEMLELDELSKQPKEQLI